MSAFLTHDKYIAAIDATLDMFFDGEISKEECADRFEYLWKCRHKKCEELPVKEDYDWLFA
jgi:hypothetical protein